MAARRHRPPRHPHRPAARRRPPRHRPRHRLPGRRRRHRHPRRHHHRRRHDRRLRRPDRRRRPHPGAWNAVLSTTLVLKGSSDHLIRDPAGVVYCHRGPGDTWLPGGASSSGAGVISQYFHGENLDVLTDQAAALDPDAVAHPLVSTGGERFPFHAPEAEPFILGDVPTRATAFHSYLLGVACLERLCFDYLDLLGARTDGPLTYTGGAARNTYWCRLRAEVLGRTVHVPEHAEGGLGMAVLAATSSGATLTEAATAMVRPAPRSAPPPTAPPLPPVYHRFVDELTRRGWLAPAVADHALRRAAQ
ncbi:FGGY-family carbohydrate kinase [Streptomyces albulus]|nr:FGGY-family carbohydrate kinase [Streptomyces noursei]